MSRFLGSSSRLGFLGLFCTSFDLVRVNLSSTNFGH